MSDLAPGNCHAMAYDEGNIFARILRGEAPCHKVYEDAATLAFLDVMPTTRGHALVLPKARAANIYEIEDEDLAAVAWTVRRIAQAAKAAFRCDGITIQQFNEPAGGQSVLHLHVHVLPRWAGIPLRPHAGQTEEPEVLAADAELLKGVLSNYLP